jgi:hypothetical protein
MVVSGDQIYVTEWCVRRAACAPVPRPQRCRLRQTVRRIDPVADTVATVFGNGTIHLVVDETVPATSTSLYFPFALARHPLRTDVLYVCQYWRGIVHMVNTTSNTLTRIAGDLSF